MPEDSSMATSITLHQAAKDGDLAAIGKFISLDFDVNSLDKHQRTALHLAAWAGQTVRASAALTSLHLGLHVGGQAQCLNTASSSDHAQLQQ